MKKILFLLLSINFSFAINYDIVSGGTIVNDDYFLQESTSNCYLIDYSNQVDSPQDAFCDDTLNRLAFLWGQFTVSMCTEKKIYHYSAVKVNSSYCVEAATCNSVQGTYSNLEGTCTDCSKFQFDKDEMNIAECACNAVGSTHKASSVLSLKRVTQGKFNYTESSIKCYDGSSMFVYYDKTDIVDSNSSSSFNNTSSSSNGNNSSTGASSSFSSLGDNNTSGSNSSGSNSSGSNSSGSNSSGSNTSGSGNDYSKVLEKISNNLQHIDDGINKEISVEPSTNSIPSDVSSALWSTYSTKWDDIKAKFDSVTDSYNNFKSTVDTAFNTPFQKGKVQTCLYSKSFEFGDLGSIPLNFDLCEVLSPLYNILYTFTYLITVFSILIFSFKSFMRLV